MTDAQHERALAKAIKDTRRATLAAAVDVISTAAALAKESGDKALAKGLAAVLKDVKAAVKAEAA